MKLLMMVVMVVMVVVMGSGMKYGMRHFMQGGGVPGVPGSGGSQFSSEESDLMATVFNSALRLFSGSATRNELASELSDKLYAGRAGAGEMSELGIELVKAGENPAAPGGAAGTAAANLPPGVNVPNAKPGAEPNAKPGASLVAKQGVRPGESSAERPASQGPTDVLGRLWERAKPYTVELTLVPVVFCGMVVAQRLRRRRSPEDAFMIPDMGIQMPTDSEPFDMKHAVHSLGTEEFELLVALIYQRQGYRVSMPAGLGGGRGGDFTLLRKSEKLLVQCKRLSQEHKVPVERVRELREAVTAAGATRGMYVTSCGFTWDARNFAKANGITLINARTLDELITAARENPDEDLLAVSQWVPKLMTKVQLTPPVCPACEAAMEHLTAGASSVWVCSQRPECRGRRSARRYQKPDPAAARNANVQEDGSKEVEDVKPVDAVKPSTAVKPASGIQRPSAVQPVGTVKPADVVKRTEAVKPTGAAQAAVPVPQRGVVQQPAPARPSGAVQQAGAVQRLGAVQQPVAAKPSGAVQQPSRVVQQPATLQQPARVVQQPAAVQPPARVVQQPVAVQPPGGVRRLRGFKS